MKWFYFLTLMTSLSYFCFASGIETCQPSSNSCEFYSCVESQQQCGKKGYLLRFGSPQCQRYLDAEKFSSTGLQQWYPKVRECLQRALLDIKPGDNCQNIQDLAFQSHVPCYVQTGFCDLSAMDYFELIISTGSALMTPEVQLTGEQISSICALKKSQPETF